MANTLKFGNGEWYGKKDTILAYNDENSNYKPLPFDFSRASSATVINKDGLIETVGSGEPRIDYKDDSKGALLLEPSRTNLLLQSNQFDTNWINSITSVLSGYLGLDGTNSAWLLTKTASSYANIRQNITFSGIHTFSVYLKKGTNTSAIIRSTGGNDARVEINLIDGTTSGESNTISVKTESVGNDWWRCSMTLNAISNTSVRIYPEAPFGGTTAGNIYMQYAQLEEGSYATSYIPTQGSAVTRLAESCINAGNDQVINSTEGVLYAEIAALANDGTTRAISINDGSTDNFVQFSFRPTSNSIRYRLESGNVLQFNNEELVTDTTIFNKVALLYGNNNFSFWVNGVRKFLVTSASTPLNLSNIDFENGANSSFFYGNIKDVRIYNTALTDQELQALTS